MSRLRGKVLVGALVVALTAAACGGDDDDDASPTEPTAPGETTTSTSGDAASASAEELCDDEVAIKEAGSVAQPELTEVSGIGESRRNPGVLWAHNDSGAGPDMYALADDGTALGRFRLDGATSTDWEDMALGTDHLYVGDIGDNRFNRPEVTVYRVAEPTVDPAQTGVEETLTGVENLTLTYEDGPHDAETLMADPVTGDVYVVTKQWDGQASGLYRIPADATPAAPVVMERLGDVAGTANQLATAGDIAADGSLVAVRTYAKVLIWDRAEGQSIAEALAADPCEAAVPFEIQGEAITFTPDGQGYVTVAEGAAPDINRLGR